VLLDELEDWVRTPIDADELDARLNELARRSGRLEPQTEVTFADGIVRVGDRWASIPDGQWPIVSLLVDRLDTVVSDREIAHAYASSGLAPNPRAVKSMMWRLGRRLSGVGIALHKVRGRGYLVELTRRNG
jgi:DNA-binding response OmpR family regulator